MPAVKKPTKTTKPVKKTTEAFNTDRDRNEFKQALGEAFGRELGAKKEKTAKKSEVKAPHLMVIARAGTGKTTTSVGGIAILCQDKPKVLKPSHQQTAIWDAMAKELPKKIRVCAFAKAIQLELEKRIPYACVETRTSHSFGYGFIRDEPSTRFAKKNEYKTINLLEQITGIDFRDMKKKGIPVNQVEEVVRLAKMNLVDANDSYLFDQFDELITLHGIECNGSYPQVLDLSREALLKSKELVQHPKYRTWQLPEFDFADMIWLPIAMDMHIPQVDLIVVDEAQDLNRCQQELCIRMGRRLVLVGDPCQPVGTLVATPNGSVAIENIRVGDRVCSYLPRSCDFIRAGYEVEGVTARPFDGELIVATSADGLTQTKYTPNHHCYANFAPLRNHYCVYLMRRGTDWRVGRSKMSYGNVSCGPVMRLTSEKADAVWILKVCESQIAAAAWEEYVTNAFGISQLMFQESNVSSLIRQRQLNWIWKNSRDCNADAIRCLERFGRDIHFPLFTNDMDTQRTLKRPAVIHACNLVDGCLMLPFNAGTRPRKVDWIPMKFRREPYKGNVYSLSVAGPSQLYIADGLVTHNCQAIFFFAGADSHSMQRMQERLAKTDRGVETLPLNITYRCGKKIVERAKLIVPDYEAYEGNPDGEIIENFKDTDLIKELNPVSTGDHVQDMVLCRVNAPLVSTCFKLLENKKKARIQGRDIGQGLIKLIDKLKAETIPDLEGGLLEWHGKELNKLQAKKFPSEAAIIALNDKLSCLMTFVRNANTVQEVRDTIEAIFTDTGTGVLLSSIHRAKGLEAKRVFLLQPEKMPHPMAKTPEAKEQEEHLKYVAITRAIETLVYVKTTIKEQEYA